MSMIDIPDSLQFYHRSAGNGQAIDALVHKIQTGDDGPTEDMGWDDLASYHKALMAAYQTRVDLWLFYKELWEHIWAPAIDQFLAPSFQKWESHTYGYELSLTNVWNGGLCRGHSVGQDDLVTWVDSDWKQIYIAFYYGNEQSGYEQSNRLQLDSSLWKAESEDDSRYTRSDLAPVRAKAQVETDRLQFAAINAVKALS